MWQSDYRYYAAVTMPDGEAVGDLLLGVDWTPALQCEYFEQRVRRANGGGQSGRTRIEPVWDEHRPYIRGVRVVTSGAAGSGEEFALEYFHDAVVAASPKLVAAGKLAVGQQFEYRIYALAEREPRAAGGNGIVVEETSTDNPAIAAAPLAALLAVAKPHLAAAEPLESTPVFLPERVLSEATDIARAAGDVEAGGILVGKLCRDESGAVFTVVTAQIPAEHTVATRESLRFTPATWASVEGAITLRGKGEGILGWHHSHPWFCRPCPAERRALCPLSRPTFSVADRSVHREVFQRAWSVALLLSFLGHDTPSYDVFGWRHGRIEPLDFFTVPDGAEGDYR